MMDDFKKLPIDTINMDGVRSDGKAHSDDVQSFTGALCQ
jgi:hypothetical protein